jgi:hypothetical protein
MRTLGATLVAAALVLVVASPALAVTGGFGIEKALRPTVTLDLGSAKSQSSGHRAACESDSTRGGPAAKKKAGSAKNAGREVTPVACEQPPRSQLLTPDELKKATAAAIAVLG